MKKLVLLCCLFCLQASLFGQKQSRAELFAQLRTLKSQCELIAQKVKTAWNKEPKAQGYLSEVETKYILILSKHEGYIEGMKQGVISGQFRRAAQQTEAKAKEIEALSLEIDQYFTKKNEELKLQHFGRNGLKIFFCKIVDCSNLAKLLENLWDKVVATRRANAEKLNDYKLRSWSQI